MTPKPHELAGEQAPQIPEHQLGASSRTFLKIISDLVNDEWQMINEE